MTTASSPDPRRPAALKVLQTPATADDVELADELNKVFVKEEAAHEKRNWVRLSYDCNNKCTFCLDSDTHDGTMRNTQEIKIQIVEGRKKGADRLILSGGEPTMHPNFLDFVKLGTMAGYRKVQTVTNGRMFSYPAFLEKAAENGLSEITFSLHGHYAKLHDRLVGVPGAFEQETAGLKAALASGRFIVNVDVVINKQNVAVLREMLDTFIEWGVKEFDLLHVIPFGNAWTDARDHLFYDLDANHEHIQKALELSKRPDVHIWLNRFPPQHAEGYEELIQDPYKLNDEVRGRREEYDRYLSIGQKLMCRQPERCQYCYLQPLCDDLDVQIATRKAESVDLVRFEGEPPIAGRLPAAPRARLVGPDLAAAKRLSQAAAAQGEIELELASYDGLAEALSAEGGSLFGKRLACAYAADPAAMEALLAIDAPFEVGVFLTNETAPALLAARPLPARVFLAQRNYDLVTESRARDVDDLRAFFAALAQPVETENVPACFTGGRPSRPARRVLDAAMLGADARIDMAKYTKRYVTDGFYTKSQRCKSCRENATCRGVHVNFVRAHGYAPLAPIPSDP